MHEASFQTAGRSMRRWLLRKTILWSARVFAYTYRYTKYVFGNNVNDLALQIFVWSGAKYLTKGNQ